MSTSLGVVAAVEPSGIASAATSALVTLSVAFALLIVIGFAVVARRTRRARRSSGPDALSTRAEHLIVRLDDTIADSVDESGYAEAQFGADRSALLDAAIASARALLTSAFAVKQKLDDGSVVSVAARRDANTRIIMLSETALDRLSKERGVLDELRGFERSAAADLVRVRELTAATRLRLESSAQAVSALEREYAASAVAPIAENVTRASRLLETAAARVETAESRIDPAGVGDASTDVRTAERDAESARHLLDAVDAHAGRLRQASVRLEAVLSAAQTEIDTARLARDAGSGSGAGHPGSDGTAASTIGDAIGDVERTLRAVPSDLRDPHASISRIEASLDSLDTALAAARSHQQRLDHARDALAGAQLTARSQIDVTRSYIVGSRGGVGADARTRLAEAERLLELASAESDPLLALDTARSSATYSRDADALARYDMLR